TLYPFSVRTSATSRAMAATEPRRLRKKSYRSSGPLGIAARPRAHAIVMHEHRRVKESAGISFRGVFLRSVFDRAWTRSARRIRGPPPRPVHARPGPAAAERERALPRRAQRPRGSFARRR